MKIVRYIEYYNGSDPDHLVMVPLKYLVERTSGTRLFKIEFDLPVEPVAEDVPVTVKQVERPSE